MDTHGYGDKLTCSFCDVLCSRELQGFVTPYLGDCCIFPLGYDLHNYGYSVLEHDSCHHQDRHGQREPLRYRKNGFVCRLCHSYGHNHAYRNENRRKRKSRFQILSRCYCRNIHHHRACHILRCKGEKSYQAGHTVCRRDVQIAFLKRSGNDSCSEHHSFQCFTLHHNSACTLLLQV